MIYWMLVIPNVLKEWVFEGERRIYKAYLTNTQREELVKQCVQFIESDVTIAIKNSRED